MKRHLAALLTALLLMPAAASAQFYTTGGERGALRWMQAFTEHYSIIFPRGADSLAGVYAAQLERVYSAEALSSGFTPAQYTRRIPVVLHTENSMSNGLVAWAPRRMELNTLPDAYRNNTATSWIKTLTTHESRHLSQCQSGYYGWPNFGRYILGDGMPSITYALYTDQWLLEGDATVAETALTGGGRGRNSDFLLHYLMSFDSGEDRSFESFAYGSYSNYSPNHYAFGYLTIASARALSGSPFFTETALKHHARHPLALLSSTQSIKDNFGKRHKQFWEEDIKPLNLAHFQENAQTRAPFDSLTPISYNKGIYTTFNSLCMTERGLYAVRSGLDRPRELVRVRDDSGVQEVISLFSPYGSGPLQYDSVSHRIFWSENMPSARYSQNIPSRIRWHDIERGVSGTLTDRYHYYFNPTVCAEGLITVEYTPQGQCSIVLLDRYSGQPKWCIQTPDGIQPVQAAMMGGRIYAACIDDDGNAIYSIDKDIDGMKTGTTAAEAMKKLLPMQYASIENLQIAEDRLIFGSDFGGVTELYAFYPESGQLKRLTSSRYGSGAHALDGPRIIVAANTPHGRQLCCAEHAALRPADVNPAAIYRYPLADTLSAQELRLAALASGSVPDTSLSAPQPYSKLSHLFKIHTWAPAYLNINNIMAGTASSSDLTAGAMAAFQNDLCSSYGTLGYSLHKDPRSSAEKRYPLRNSLHFSWTYNELLPVIEVSADYNDRKALNIWKEINDTGLVKTKKGYSDRNYFGCKIKLSVPLKFHSGGWYRNVTPAMSYSLSNDLYDNTIRQSFQGHFTNTLRGSLTLTATQAKPVRNVYPRFGGGILAALAASPGSKGTIAPAAILQAYGYLPGFRTNDGLRLAAIAQKPLARTGSCSYDLLTALYPRGFRAKEDIFSKNTPSYKLSVDYAMPFNSAAFSLGRLFYIKRVVAKPFFDFTSFTDGSLCSAGGAVTFTFGNFFGFNRTVDAGVSYSRNFGSAFGGLFSPSDRNCLTPVFAVEF